MRKYLQRAGVIWLVFVLAACPGDSGIIEVNKAGWRIQHVWIPPANVYEILKVGDRDIPIYEDCPTIDEYPLFDCSLDVLIVASSGYKDADGDIYTSHVQDIILKAFGAPNAMNRDGEFDDPLLPFRFYATDYRNSNVSMPGKHCFPGLPVGWAPPPDNVDSEKPIFGTADPGKPSWSCNLALSTGGMGINVGLLMHKTVLNDTSQYNLFTAEYNSYATILHELSHAAFIISDESPLSGLLGLREAHIDFPNVFVVGSSVSCEKACKNEYASGCVGIGRLDGNSIVEDTTYARCESDTTSNLMYFYPVPPPGENDNLADFRFYHGALARLKDIYHKCRKAEC